MPASKTTNALTNSHQNYSNKIFYQKLPATTVI